MNSVSPSTLRKVPGTVSQSVSGYCLRITQYVRKYSIPKGTAGVYLPPRKMPLSLFLQRLFAELAEGTIHLQDYHDPTADAAKCIRLFPEPTFLLTRESCSPSRGAIDLLPKSYMRNCRFIKRWR